VKNGTVIPVFGEAIEIIASSTSTNYTFVIGVQTSPPGGGPPPLAISGRMRFSLWLKGNSNSLTERSGSPSIAVRHVIRYEERTTGFVMLARRRAS
jgi:hypothetical protein